jgi:hypothetical protein
MDGPPRVTGNQAQLDAAAVRAAMAAASDQDVVKAFVKFAILADLSDEEIEALRNEAAKRSGVGKRTIMKMLRTALHERAAKRRREAQERKLAERSDPRAPGSFARTSRNPALLHTIPIASSASAR